jgi:hypothetical protein
MTPDVAAIAQRQDLYAKFWRRRIAGIYHSSGSETQHVDVYAFRPTLKPWAPVNRFYVYMTGGMADAPMPGAGSSDTFSRVELSCYALTAPGFANPQTDEIAKWLHTFARLAFSEGQPINPGDTFNVGTPLAPESEMSAFYFGFTPFIDKDALRRATLNAEAVAHLVPISEAERSLAEREGSIALVEAFGRAAVMPVFDLSRPSCV